MASKISSNAKEDRRDRGERVDDLFLILILLLLVVGLGIFRKNDSKICWHRSTQKSHC